MTQRHPLRATLAALVLLALSSPAWGQNPQAQANPPTLNSGDSAGITQTLNGGLRVQEQDGSGHDVSATNPLPVSAVSGTIISTGQVRLVIQGTLSTQSGTYAANNAEGALVTLPNFGRSGASGKIEWVNLIDNNGNKVQSDAFFFNQNPTGSTCTDKTAASFVKADQSKMIGVVHLGDFSQLGNGTPQLLQSLAVDMPFRLPAAATSAFVCFVTRGTPVFVSTSDLTYQVSVVQDLD